MQYAFIPSGDFLMGSPGDEPGRDADEGQRRVTISEGFYLKVTEVTQDEWSQVMHENPSRFKGCGTCPVETVSWEEIQQFIYRLNQKAGKGSYRLPTEAEWEYACRAGTQTALSSGIVTELRCGYDPRLDLVGWYQGNAGSSPHPVAQKEPNPWGLYDMHGNLWEWCHDYYGDRKEDAGRVVDPGGPAFGWGRVIRGGGWNFFARCSRSANRKWVRQSFKSHSIGFRLVLSQENSK